MRIPSGKTDQAIYFVAVDITDLKTRETGLGTGTFTAYRSRNGGAAVAYTTPTFTEISAANMPGVYSLLIDEDTTIAAGSDSEEYVLHITQAAMAPVTRVIELYRRDTTSGRTLAVDASSRALSDVDTIKTNPVVNAGTITFPTTATLASTTNITAGTITTATNVTTVNGLAANVITAAATAADFGTEVASAVWDMDATAHQTLGTFGQAIGDPGADTDTIWALANANLDAAVSSRMATYVQPTGFLTATFPAGTIANTTNITAGTITTTTNLTNLPAITANWLTAAGTAADFTTEIQAGLALSTQVDALEGDVTAIKAKTDSLTYTTAGLVDVNVQQINDVTITGNGQAGTEFGV